MKTRERAGAALWSLPFGLGCMGMSANYGPPADKAKMSVEGHERQTQRELDGGQRLSRRHLSNLKAGLMLALYRARNRIERFFNEIKQCRRLATAYDKLAANYLAFVQLASIRLWLRANESTPLVHDPESAKRLSERSYANKKLKRDDDST